MHERAGPRTRRRVPPPPSLPRPCALVVPPCLALCSYREAVHSFQAAVRVQAGDPLAHFRIGNALFALKRYPDARKVCWAAREGGLSWGVGMGLGWRGRAVWECEQARQPFNNLPSLPSPHSRQQQAYGRALKCCRPGSDDALQPKVYVNLGITQEAEGLLMSACDHYK